MAERSCVEVKTETPLTTFNRDEFVIMRGLLDPDLCRSASRDVQRLARITLEGLRSTNTNSRHHVRPLSLSNTAFKRHMFPHTRKLQVTVRERLIETGLTSVRWGVGQKGSFSTALGHIMAPGGEFSAHRDTAQWSEANAIAVIEGKRVLRVKPADRMHPDIRPKYHEMPEPMLLEVGDVVVVSASKRPWHALNNLEPYPSITIAMASEMHTPRDSLARL